MSGAKKTHLILTKLYSFGGTNNHLKELINYLGKENVVLVLANSGEMAHLGNITELGDIRVIFKQQLHSYANLEYRFTTNVKEFFKIAYAIAVVKLLTLKYNCATINICSAEPEKYLYLLWVPFIKVFYFLHSAPQPKYARFTSFTCNKTLGTNKKIITVSNANKRAVLQSWDISTRKSQFVNVIYNCLPADYELNKEPRKEDNKFFTVVTLAHVIEYKNPLTWLAVAKTVTTTNVDIVFKWVGDGPLFNHFKEAAKGLDRIHFEGYSNAPQGYLANADIYYQPSLYESHGIAVVEAMAHHLPCVVSNIGGLPESVENGYNGILTDPCDENEQARAILTLYNDLGMRYAYGNAGYKRYQEFFTNASFIKNMNAIYNV